MDGKLPDKRLQNLLKQIKLMALQFKTGHWEVELLGIQARSLYSFWTNAKISLTFGLGNYRQGPVLC